MSIFNDLEIIHKGEFKIGGDITLPFLFHIKDIKDSSVNERIMSTEYRQLGKYKQIKEAIDSIAYYIDRELFLIDEKDKESLEKLGIKFIKDDLIKNKYQLVDETDVKLLIKHLELSEFEIYDIREYIVDSQNELIKNFLDILTSRMENGVKSEHISESFMEIQICSEFGNDVIFKENLGKSMSEFSFRELQTKRAYLSRKYEVEKIQMDKLKADTKKG